MQLRTNEAKEMAKDFNNNSLQQIIDACIKRADWLEGYRNNTMKGSKRNRDLQADHVRFLSIAGDLGAIVDSNNYKKEMDDI